MGKLTNLNPSKALTEADLPQTVAFDGEVAAAIEAIQLTGFKIFPRTGSVAFDFNNWSPPAVAFAARWVDNAVTNPGSPPGNNYGNLFQLDLFISSSPGLYRCQILVSFSGQCLSRAQNNGIWTPWQ